MKQFSRAFKVGLCLLVLAAPAIAQKPSIQLLSFSPQFIPTAAACGFGVLITPEAGAPNGERLIQFTNPVSTSNANIAIIAGPLFVTLTNVATGKSVDVNVSGPTLFSFSETTNTETVTLLGPEIPGALPANLATAAGLPLLPLINGRAVFTFVQGALTSISFTGTADDVCQLLQ